MADASDVDRTAEWDALRAAHLAPAADRAPTTGRGVHHQALLSSDVERTIRFYQDLLEFPLTELFENRDHPGSTHFFFDIGNGNSLAISVERPTWERLQSKLDDEGVDYLVVNESSMYFSGPDGERLELISDALGEMYGTKIG